MRPDQLTRLADLSEKLAEDVLVEADPGNWPGAGVPFEDWDKAIRGDRYWMKKNAAASMALLMRVEQLRADRQKRDGEAPASDEPDVDKDIAAAEREASRLLDKAMRSVDKKAFDEHVRGKKR